uniref:RILP-like interacting lysosomal protein-like 1 and 2 (Rilpl1 and Rilpl2) n=2 Tax=unclassified Caudoviricetes TaxID=2788787 RepID=A0A8S5QKS0_9CAUD|nr:MAG TPA: RILP-like interacting lysosomal protein-like 1 and 2 (Rilpl1 and Rilpl2) [Siphoviridae sp. ctVii20]DAE19393.1 MAG TPA: RILP-like interacting lysosomal protein-like 1 and 2 (Rilpl1 and Rilpl2) [Siphoviridae sp. ctezl47]
MAKQDIRELAAALENCGKALLKVAEAMQASEMVKGPDEKAMEPSPKKLTLEDVRKIAAGKSRLGFTEDVRALIKKYGADRLSGISEEKYADFLKELEAIGHAG